jgi:hypothetical protein
MTQELGISDVSLLGERPRGLTVIADGSAHDDPRELVKSTEHEIQHLSSDWSTETIIAISW